MSRRALDPLLVLHRAVVASRHAFERALRLSPHPGAVRRVWAEGFTTSYIAQSIEEKVEIHAALRARLEAMAEED
jgi:hypothetical protein